jgi:hypothetical protein
LLGKVSSANRNAFRYAVGDDHKIQCDVVDIETLVVEQAMAISRSRVLTVHRRTSGIRIGTVKARLYRRFRRNRILIVHRRTSGNGIGNGNGNDHLSLTP